MAQKKLAKVQGIPRMKIIKDNIDRIPLNEWEDD